MSYIVSKLIVKNYMSQIGVEFVKEGIDDVAEL